MAPSKRVVFVIDHEEEIRVTHETILRSEGYEIVSASDGIRGLELLREEVPDLLLLGTRIGVITPPQLIRMVKTDAVLFRLPIIVCLTEDQAMLKSDVLRAGADATIESPASSHELVREVVSLIGRR